MWAFCQSIHPDPLLPTSSCPHSVSLSSETHAHCFFLISHGGTSCRELTPSKAVAQGHLTWAEFRNATSEQIDFPRAVGSSELLRTLLRLRRRISISHVLTVDYM